MARPCAASDSAEKLNDSKLHSAGIITDNPDDHFLVDRVVYSDFSSFGLFNTVLTASSHQMGTSLFFNVQYWKFTARSCQPNIFCRHTALLSYYHFIWYFFITVHNFFKDTMNSMIKRMEDHNKFPANSSSSSFQRSFWFSHVCISELRHYTTLTNQYLPHITH